MSTRTGQETDLTNLRLLRDRGLDKHQVRLETLDFAAYAPDVVVLHGRQALQIDVAVCVVAVAREGPGEEEDLGIVQTAEKASFELIN